MVLELQYDEKDDDACEVCDDAIEDEQDALVVVLVVDVVGWEGQKHLDRHVNRCREKVLEDYLETHLLENMQIP